MNGPLHSLLRRQLRRCFGGEQDYPPQADSFVDAVNAAYRLADEDRARLERSLDLSSRELVARNEELRATLAAFPDIIYRLATDGVILDVSAGRVEDLHLPPRQLVGRKVQDGLPEPLGRALELALRRAALSGQPASLEYPLESPVGKKYWEARIARCGDGRLLMIARDITERVKAQEALRAEEDRRRQSQKLEEIGRLAGGIAHDFNNLLTVILGLAESLAGGLPEGLQKADAAEILQTGRRAANLTQQLLGYSRRQIISPRVVDFNEIVIGIGKLIGRVIGEHVEIAYQLAAGPKPVRVDPGQMEQLLVNLCVNARDAMPEGGVLTVATDDADVSEDFARAHPGLKPGRHVRLSVRDTGGGMAPEVLAHVFEPFFTTKEPGRGTGLGLATCFGIVRQNGGCITAASRPGKGSRFDVFLPRAQSPAQPQDDPAAAAPRSRGGETLLLVEDDDSVRRMTARVLRQHGYEVREAGDGEQGLAQVKADAEGRLGLVITDMIMPKLGGGRMAREILRLRPRAKILYVTGYTDDEAVGRGLDERQVLRKPFTLDALVRRVRESLDA